MCLTLALVELLLLLKKLAFFCLDNLRLQQFSRIRSQLRIDMKHLLNNCP